MILLIPLFVTVYVFHTQAQFPMPYPGAMPMAMGNMGMPSMPVQMPIVGPPQLPSVVMPYHSRTADKLRERQRKPKKKRNKKKRYESESESHSESDSHSAESDEGKFKSRRSNKHKMRRQVLTPVVSYVTNDGYVVYQKRIKKDRAKDWLELGKNSDSSGMNIRGSASDEIEMGREENQKRRAKSRRNRF